MTTTIKAGIIGATGYAGIQLYKIILQHPQAEVIAMGSREHIGDPACNEFPELLGQCNLPFVAPTDDIFYTCDVIFFATPHGVAMKSAQQFLDKNIKVIDLGADFRIKNLQVWQDWYGMEHTSPQLVENCVYGLPENYENEIKNASLIANPGCYPTAITLGLTPLLKNKLIDTQTIIADCKSGVSGAGRKPQIGTLLCEASENLKAYGVNHHRHKPEIEQELSMLAQESIEITFVPHLIPMKRGMLATIYTTLTDNATTINIQELFDNYYKNNDSVHILANETQPQTASVVGTNNCQIGLKQSGNMLIITSVIDNVIKGASGQAVQNMNIMFGLDVNTGL
jgi:N-acetyl-gamma-glutamyl-phosphate reductase